MHLPLKGTVRVPVSYLIFFPSSLLSHCRCRVHLLTLPFLLRSSPAALLLPLKTGLQMPTKKNLHHTLTLTQYIKVPSFLMWHNLI